MNPIQNPPAVPARNVVTQRPAYAGGFTGGYGYSGYSGLGNSYSPYGMYNAMYGGYGMNRFGSCIDDGSGSGFAQQAELSSRQAFQSIESVVQAVGSVAAMLESTFQAVYNSFRAVIGVADHMSRLRAHLTRIFSALAIFRTLKWLAYRLLNFLRLRTPTGLEDELWSQAGADTIANAAAEIDPSGVSRSSWPVMLFFAIVVGGPWLIWKFLSSLSGSNGMTNVLSIILRTVL
jgi:peroxin-13